MTATDLNAHLLIQIPRALPQVRIWRQNTGGGVPMGTVKKAVQLIKCGRIEDGIGLLLSRPIKFGIEGGGDLSGILGSSGRRLEIEGKAGNDKMSDEQKAFRAVIISRGGIYIEARSVEECIEELRRWV